MRESSTWLVDLDQLAKDRRKGEVEREAIKQSLEALGSEADNFFDYE